MLGSPLVSGSKLRFDVGCSTNAFGFGFQECLGTAVLTTTERLSPNGSAAVVDLELNGAGRRLLAKFARLPGKLRITAGAPEPRTPPKAIVVKVADVELRARAQPRRYRRRAR